MLRDRKYLTEEEIAKVKQKAANLYLDITLYGNTAANDLYQELKAKLASLEFDLEMIDLLIEKGHE